MFTETWTEADGFRIRAMVDGEGPPLVHLHGAGGLYLTPAHDLLARHFRVIAFEMPGFGEAGDNQRTRSMPELASTMAAATRALGHDRVKLMGSSFGGKVSLWLAAQHPDLVDSIVLEAPAAIRPANMVPPRGTPEEVARRLFAHPDRAPPLPAVSAETAERTMNFVRRMRGPDRDADLEAAMAGIKAPTLVVWGTLDSVIPPTMGHFYKTLLPDAHLVLVYDAGHVITADRPEAFVEVVTDFLQRTDAFVINQARTVLAP